MPRKQNGFGNPRSLAFKGVNTRTDIGKSRGAAGNYPSDRRFGSSVQRSVIEKYNLDSNWTKWRKGYEYYNQAAWYRLQDVDDFSGEYKDSQIQSKLYQGTPYEVDVVFDGYKFATKNADSSNHYVMKRTPVSSPDLGTITGVYNDDLKYPEYKANRELRVKGNPGADSRLLLQMIGERITDGETEATLNYILNEKEHPALYIGKTYEEPTEVKVSVDTSTILLNQEFENPQELVGKIVWIKNFFVEKPISSFIDFEFIDAPYYFGVRTLDKVSNVELEVLDPENEVLPPTLYDIASLPSIFTSDDASYTVSGLHIFQKELYQKYFGKQYLTGDLVSTEVSLASYSILPFKILGVQVDGSRLEFTSVPFHV